MKSRFVGIEPKRVLADWPHNLDPLTISVYRKEVDNKDRDLSKHRVEIDRLNKELLIAQKSREVLEQQSNSKVKKKKEDKDESVLKELQSVKKDLEAARRANSKLEKDLIDINNAKQKVKIS